MRKIILIIAVFTFIADFIEAQGSGDLKFGLKAGANFSNVYDIQGEEFQAEYKPGLAAGIFLTIPLGKYLGIQPELLFSQKGYKSTGNILGDSYKFTHTANYIDIPILLEFKPKGFITVVAGPQYSYLVKIKNDFTNSFITVQQQQDFDNIDIRKNTLCFLGGIDFNVSRIVLGTRVGWDILNNNGDGTSTSPRYKNVWYQATLGVRF